MTFMFIIGVLGCRVTWCRLLDPSVATETETEGPDVKAELPAHLAIAKDVMERCTHLLSHPSLRLRLKVCVCSWRWMGGGGGVGVFRDRKSVG